MNKFALALAVVVGSFVSSNAEAGIKLNLSANIGSEIVFVGNGSGATVSFTPGAFSSSTFVITSLSGASGTNAGLGLQGSIGGTFSYTTASITSDGIGGESATLVGNGANTFTIIDNAGVPQTFSANIAGINISTAGTSGAINYTGSVNLTNVVYNGTNADLLILKQQTASPSGGIATITFQFIPGQSLTQLASGSLSSPITNSTSYSGTVTSVPEPGSLAMAFTGVALLGAGCYRRRRSLLS